MRHSFLQRLVRRRGDLQISKQRKREKEEKRKKKEEKERERQYQKSIEKMSLGELQDMQEKKWAELDRALYRVQISSSWKQKQEKTASVVGRAVAGGIIGGAPGAIVGAISAADKNNRNK